MKDSIKLPIRNVDGGSLMETFLISAIVSILVIRAFLHLTGYPSIGRGQYHIAHMLWGGLLMMIAITLLLSFLNRETKIIASVIGGIGFGTFLDELGKFITRDNNYFFKPTIAIIYVIFVLLFFLFRLIEEYQNMSKLEYEINALEFMKDAISHNLNREEKKQAMHLLRKSDAKNPTVVLLRQMFKEIDTIPPQENFLSRTETRLRSFYTAVISDPWFTKLVIWFFIATSLINFFHAFLLVSRADSFAQQGQLLSTILSGLFVIAGVLNLQRKNRLRAYRFFRYSVLASILLTQFFLFYQDQLSAIGGLFVNLILLSILQYLMREETLLEKTEEKNSVERN